MAVNLKTPQEIRIDLAARARARRLDLNLSQEGLARHSGVSLGSVKRFERIGQISLESLLKIALVLDAMSEFDHLFPSRLQAPASLDDFRDTARRRQRGRKK